MTRYRAKYPGASSTQAGNIVVMTNGSGVGSVTFPEAFAAAPVVVAWGGNGEALTSVHPAATTTGFTFTAYTQAGALMTSVNVRVLWIAHPAS